ncbi:MAG TPA: type II toxin-antitoxin system PemK/MazF family toxin [Allosphingosinicella sp.]|jgi:mRNA interferase MazF|nr:type II toxin-antitoxin system PemK/MazF family toxin [Allosphingosinicella sp.]
MVTPPAVSQGEIWWADLADPVGSAPGDRRPVLVVQGDAFNRSRIATVVCVPLTGNLKWADAPGNVALTARQTGLDRDAVANVSLIVALDKEQLTERMGRVPQKKLELVLKGVDVVLGK